MKKILLLPCLVGFLVSIAFGEIPVYTCVKREKPLNLDGPFEGKWKDVPPIILEEDHHYFPLTTLPRKGNEDLSARAGLCYDDQNLYFAVTVRDDILTQKGIGLDAWNGDSLQFAISDDGKLNYWECILALGRDGPIFMCYQAGTGCDPMRVTQQVRYRIPKMDSTHVRYQITLPWSILAPLNPSNDSFRFSFIVNDADNGPRKAWMEWATPSGIGVNKNPAEYGIVRLKKEKVAAYSPLQGRLNLDRKLFTDDDELRADLTVSAGKSLSARVVFAMTRAGQKIAENTREILIGNVPGKSEFVWKTAQLPGGWYDLTAVVFRKDGVKQGTYHNSFEKINQKEVDAVVSEFQKEGNILADLLKQCEQKSIPAPYQTAVYTLIDHFAPMIRWDLTIKDRPYNPQPDAAPLTQPEKIVGRLRALYWNRARRNAEFVRDQVRRAVVQTRELLKNPNLAVSIPPLDLDSLTFGGGIYRDKNGPTLLVGGMFGAVGMVKDEMKTVAKYGFNFWGISSGAKVYVDTPREQWEDCYMKYPDVWTAYRRAAELNIAVVTNFTWYQNPVKGEVHDKGCGTVWGIDIDDPNQTKVVSNYLQTIGREMAGQKAQKSFMLFNEVTYGFCGCSRGRRDFQNAMRRKYETIEKLNAQWGSKFKEFKEFNELNVPKDRKANIGQWYDYNCMHQDKLPARLKWTIDQIRKTNPRSWTHTKIMNTLLDCYDYCAPGVDREKIGEVTDVFECDGVIGYGRSGQFALSPWSEVTAYDLFRSLKPNATLMETEFHILPYDYWDKIDDDYIKGCHWLAAVHGVDAFIPWVWFRGGYNYANINSIDCHADRTLAFATAALDLRRLAKDITAFSTQQSQVAVLFSTPSMINYENQWNLLMEIYRGLYWFNMPPTDFLTDKQIADGKINDYTLLVIHATPYLLPKTLEKIKSFVRAGGVLVVTQDAPRWDPYGKPLNISDLIRPQPVYRFGKGSVYSRKTPMPMEKWAQYFGKVFDDAKIPLGSLTLKDKYHHPLIGVENREAIVDGRQIIYLMNLTADPVEIPLPESLSLGCEDLVTRKNFLTSRLSLKPLVPFLLTPAKSR